MSTTLIKNGGPATNHAPVEVIRPDAPVTDQPLIETFRLLALNIDRLLGEQVERSVLVLSARADDGRSLVAASMAAALAEVCPRVLLVKADPIGTEDGLYTNLSHSTANGWLRVADCNRPGAASQIDFVASVTEVIEEGLRQGATVVVDAPACTTSTVAFHLARTIGGVLYLARQRAESPEVHRDIRAQLDLLGANVLGVVFNEA